jgi:hypothetical protein
MQATTTERTAAKDADLHSGLDYEMARKRLEGIASVKFNELFAATESDDEELATNARAAYQLARAAAADLHPQDAAAIAAVLRGDA